MGWIVNRLDKGKNMKTLQNLKKCLVSESEHTYEVTFQVLNMGDDLWNPYHHSVGYFCDEIILNQGKKPNGTWDVHGHDETNTISVVYNKRQITVPEIQNFLESYGLKIEKVKDTAFKKFLGSFEVKVN